MADKRVSDDPRPLGSFARPEPRQENPDVPGTRTCLHCGGDRLTRIRMRTPSGRDAVFVACGACERTAWFDVAGTGVPLTADQVGGLGV
ncbi:MAG: hypothetical protein FWH11_04335 [Micrococcales bacterium]|nr:hypothetical protein [Micrococcales bacterium]